MGRQAGRPPSGDRFVAALNLSDGRQACRGGAALDAIAKDGSGGYPVLASFRAPVKRLAAGDDKGAVADYDAIAAGPSTPAAASGDLAQAPRRAHPGRQPRARRICQTRIGDLAETGNPWRHSAREILGLAAWRSERLHGRAQVFPRDRRRPGIAAGPPLAGAAHAGADHRAPRRSRRHAAEAREG